MRKLILAAALIHLSCAGLPWPKPEPTPPPDPCRAILCAPGTIPQPQPDGTCKCVEDPNIPWECPLASTMPECTAAGMTCGDCWHNPTSDPKHCEKAPDCPVEPPPVEPPPATGCVPDANDPKWGTPTNRPTKLYAEYQAVIKAVGNRCGEASPDESKQMITLRMIAAKWTELYGRCAEQSADSVSARADDGLFEEWHAVYFGNGCIIDGPNAYKNAWPYEAALPPPSACPEPRPSQTAWKMNCKMHGAYVDCTPVTVMTCEYCKAIGMGEMEPGVPRCGCPMRNEGDPDRVACEEHALGGRAVVDSRNGATCQQRENQFQFFPNGGNCRLCNPAKTICGAWF